MYPKLMLEKRTKIFLAWISLALLGLVFHEPWRDEAQAWLVARSSFTLGELFLRSSIEASGPIYYLLIWPFAQFYPQTFPESLQIVSFLGTFLAALWWIFRIRSLSTVVRFAGIFSLFFIYEYAAISRLYGWGLFFIFLGFDLQSRGKNIGGQIAFGLAFLTQFTVAIAAAVLLFSMTISATQDFRKLAKELWLSALLGSLALLHVSIGRDLHPWTEPIYPTLMSLLNAIGTSLSTPFFPNYNPTGVLGSLSLGMLLLIGQKRNRLIYFAGLCIFSYVFIIIYRGIPSPRHGGSLFFVWLLLVNPQLSWKYSPALRYGLGSVMIFSLFQGFLRIYKEVRFKFSDSIHVAHQIAEVRCKKRELAIFSHNNYTAAVVAARLNTSLWLTTGKAGCPFYEGLCSLDLQTQRSLLPDCARFDCFYVGQINQEIPKEFSHFNFQNVYSTREHLLSDEGFRVARTYCE